MSGSVQKQIQDLVEDTKDFAQKSIWFVKKCTKPDKAEFTKIASSCAIGFAVMGVVGYVIKLVFIPINNIILSTA